MTEDENQPAPLPKKKKGGKPGKSGKKHFHSHSREVAMQALYQIEVVDHPVSTVLRFSWLNEPMPAATQEYCIHLIQGVTDNWEALDGVIGSLSHKDVTQISVINRCILRTGIFEIMEGKLDPGIVMDDLLNLTRKYEGEDSVAFVNGILDRFDRERRGLLDENAGEE